MVVSGSGEIGGDVEEGGDEGRAAPLGKRGHVFPALDFLIGDLDAVEARVPAEFRRGLDAYFNALEDGSER